MNFNPGFINISQLLSFVVPLLLIEGFFSGSEIALLSADKLQLRRKANAGDEGARIALELAGHPERILSTTLLVTNLCMIGISGLIALFFSARGSSHRELLSIAVTSPLIVILGELLPKTIYQRYADRIAPRVAGPLYVAYLTFYPITRVFSGYTSRLSRLIGPIEEMLTGKRRSTREDLLSLLSFGKKESEIKATARQMIRRILDFQGSSAKHALIPLVRVEAIEDTSLVHEALERFESHRHSRMPVYSERIDNIVGVLENSRLFSAAEAQQPIKHYVTEAHYVSETQRLEDVLMDMRREDEEMVIVVDEHGGAVGILTFEDIVEEIVGEINDEYDSEAALYKEISPTSWIVQARMETHSINETLAIELPEGDYETLSGFLLQQFGRIPEVRDELFFTTPRGTFKFTIRKATERHIDSVLIERIE